MVIVVDENLPRNNWLMGRIVSTYLSADGLVRSGQVQTRNVVCCDLFVNCVCVLNNWVSRIKDAIVLIVFRADQFFSCICAFFVYYCIERLLSDICGANTFIKYLVMLRN